MLEFQRETVGRHIRSSSKHLKALNLSAGVFERARPKSCEHRTLHALLCCDIAAKRPSRLPRLHKCTSLPFDGVNRRTVEDTIAILRSSAANIHQNLYDTVDIAKDTVSDQRLRESDLELQHIDVPAEQLQLHLQSANPPNSSGQNETVNSVKPAFLRPRQKPSGVQDSKEIKAIKPPEDDHYHKYKINCAPCDIREPKIKKEKLSDVRTDKVMNDKYTVDVDRNAIANCQTEVKSHNSAETRKRRPHKPCRKFGISVEKIQPIEEEFHKKPVRNAKHEETFREPMPMSICNRPGASVEYSNQKGHNFSKYCHLSKCENQTRFEADGVNGHKKRSEQEMHIFESAPINLTVTYCNQGNCCDKKHVAAKSPIAVNSKTSAQKSIFYSSRKSKSIQPISKNDLTVAADAKSRLSRSTRAYLRSLRDYTVAELLRLEIQRVRPDTVGHLSGYYSDCCELLMLYKSQRRRVKRRRNDPDPKKAIQEFEKYTKDLQAETIKIQDQLTEFLQQKAFERKTNVDLQHAIVTAEGSVDEYRTKKGRKIVVPLLDLSNLEDDAPASNQKTDKSLHEKNHTITPRGIVRPDSGNTSDGISSIREYVNDAQVGRKLARWDNQMMMRLPSNEIGNTPITNCTLVKQNAMVMGQPAVTGSEKYVAMKTVQQIPQALRQKGEAKHTVAGSPFTPYGIDRIESGRASIVIASNGSSTIVGSARSTVVPSARSVDMSMDSLESRIPQGSIDCQTNGQPKTEDHIAANNHSRTFFGDLCRPLSSAEDLVASLDWPEDLGQIKVKDELNELYQVEIDEDFWFDKFPFGEKKRENELNLDSFIEEPADAYSPDKIQIIANDAVNIDAIQSIEADRHANETAENRNKADESKSNKFEAIPLENESKYSPRQNHLNVHLTEISPTDVKENQIDDIEVDRSVGDDLTFSELDSSDDLQLLSNIVSVEDSDDKTRGSLDRSKFERSIDDNLLKVKEHRREALQIIPTTNEMQSNDSRHIKSESEDKIELESDLNFEYNEIRHVESIFDTADEPHKPTESSNRFHPIFNDMIKNESSTSTKSDQSISTFEEENLSESLASDDYNSDSKERKLSSGGIRGNDRFEVASSDSTKSSKSTQKASIESDSNTETSIHENIPDNVDNGSDDLSEL